MTENNQWTPERIKALRLQLGMKQTIFASAMGATQATVSLWESGGRVPNGITTRLLGIFDKNHELAYALFRVPLDNIAKL